MKKYIAKLSFFLLLTTSSYAQQWDSLAGGLPSTAPTIDGVNALAIYSGYLYAGGTIYVDSTYCIGYWNGNKWKRAGYGIESYYYPCGNCPGNVPAVYALAEYKGNLFVGGFFDDSISNTNVYYSIIQWNNSTWDSVSSGLPRAYNQLNYANDAAYCLAVYQNVLYMGGNYIYTKAGTQVNYITQWSGGQWEPVNIGMNGPVSALAVYNGNLYAGGGFTLAGGTSVNNIARWDGIQWNSVGSGIKGSVVCLYVLNGKLYAGGTFDSAGRQKALNIACWNDTIWAPVGLGIPNATGNNYYGTGVYALSSYGPDLCAGGIFDTAGNIPANNVALWNGSTWSNLSTGTDGVVNALIEYNGALIAGGYFDTAGGIPVNNIAQWISPLGINNLSSTIQIVKVYPNPNNGNFTLEYNLGRSITGKVALYNTLGQGAGEYNLEGSQGKMSISNPKLPNGVYLWKLYTTNEAEQFGKIIIMK